MYEWFKCFQQWFCESEQLPDDDAVELTSFKQVTETGIL